jgi:hypothetical protein
MTDNEDDRFRQAHHAASRLVAQGLNHVNATINRMGQRIEVAPPSSPVRQDYASARAGGHSLAFHQTIAHLDALNYGIESNLQGLDVLMKHGTFSPVPATLVARAICEGAATCAWLLDPKVTADQRAARGYASLFRSLQKGISEVRPEDAGTFVAIRDRLINDLETSQVAIRRRAKDGKECEDVSLVKVGTEQARIGFTISQRVAKELPQIGGLYGSMSGVVHGEPSWLETARTAPDGKARLIGAVVRWSVEAWSGAVHAWVGVEHGRIFNENDFQRLIGTIAPERLEEFERERREHAD